MTTKTSTSDAVTRLALELVSPIAEAIQQLRKEIQARLTTGGLGSGTLGLQEQRQEQTEWCWAATSVSITLYYDSASTWTQCLLVNQQFGQTTCCQDGSTSQCNQPWYPDKALTATGHLASTSSGKLPIQTIMNEIDASRPISIAVYWNGGGGHNPAVDGYDNTDSAAPTIDVQDPWYGQSVQDYNTFPSSYQGGATWGESYFTS